jgi:phosphatidylethanolamine/phosphatidyl-N-methylethanolamine N-methyltransferase
MLTKFLKQGRSIASFAPSSRYMARSIVRGIDFNKARCIVELGAGASHVFHIPPVPAAPDRHELPA